MNKALNLCLLLSVFGCSSKEIDCQDELADGKAIYLKLAQTEGTCDYQASLELEGKTSSMKCGEDGSECICTGGTEYGTYRIYLTGKDNVTLTAVQDVTQAPSPTCFSHEVIERMHPVDGMGGAGGAAN